MKKGILLGISIIFFIALVVTSCDEGIFGSLEKLEQLAAEENTPKGVNSIVIDSAIIQITPPAKGAMPNTTASTEDTGYTCSAVSWDPNHNPFQGGVPYTATVTLIAGSGYTFTGLTNVKINTQDATVNSNTGGSVTLLYTFPATLAKTVTGMAINTHPSKLSYKQEETLDLSGLVVTLTYDDSTTENVELSNFNIYNIITDPMDGTTLSRSAHNGQSVKVIQGGVSANTNILTVIAPPSEPQSFSATPGNQQVTLSWAAPADNGGSYITAYQVSNDNGSTWITPETETSHTFDGLNNGVLYYFRVRANNAAGNGAEAFITASPLAPTLLGTVTVSGDDNWVNGVITAGISGSNASAPFNYEWRRGNPTTGAVIATHNNVSSTTDNYTIVNADRSQNIYVIVSKTGYSGTISNTPDYLVSDYIGIYTKAHLEAVTAGNNYLLAFTEPELVISGTYTPPSNYDNGTFDGKGKTVNFSSPTFSGTNVGLFRDIYSTGKVKNIRLKGTISYQYSGDSDIDIDVGALAGSSSGTIQYISSSVKVTGTHNGTESMYSIMNSVGGIVGEMGGGTIENCYSTGTVTANGTRPAGTTNVGGIAGMQTGGTIGNCWAGGDITGSSATNEYMHDIWPGGIVGVSVFSNVQNCVALNPDIKNGKLHVAQRIGNHYEGVFYNNYAGNLVKVNGAVPGLPDLESDGATTSSYSGQSFWTLASPNGPGWTWGTTEAYPWKWYANSVNRPILYFETTLNQ